MSNHSKPGFKRKVRKFIKYIRRRKRRFIIPAIVIVCIIGSCILFGPSMFDKGGATVDESKHTQKQQEIEKENEKISELDGKVCVCFGDSVTAGSAKSNYTDILAEQTGMKVYNLAVPFTRLSDHPSEDVDAFSMYNLADAISADNYDKQLKNAGNDERKLNMVKTLEEIDWNTVDFITLCYGAHEIKSSEILDNKDDPNDTTTFLGALRRSIDRIRTAYPNIEIVVMTPLYRFWDDTNSNEYIVGDIPYTKWVDTVISTAMEEDAFCINLYQLPGFDKSNQDLYYNEDGFTPNSKGQAIVGKIIAEKMIEKYGNKAD